MLFYFRTCVKRKYKHIKQGFSLIEMMIVIAIVVTMAMMSFPSLLNIKQHADTTLLQTQLIHAVQLARVTVRSRQVGVSICHSSDLQQCDNGQHGLLVFLDNTASGVLKQRVDILAAISLPVFPGQLFWRSYPKYRHYLHFEPERFITADNGMFWYCEAHARFPRFALAVSNTGMTRLLLPNRDGLIVDSHQKRIICD